MECSINRKIKDVNTTISSFYGIDVKNSVFYRAAGGGYFLLIKNQKSETIIDGVQEDVKAEKSIQIIQNFLILELVRSFLHLYSIGIILHTQIAGI